ncbi:MAG TPA: ATP-dependent DNA ligase [Jatrophihabitantaceae bacterium]|nr:ATP-dependent DNA ligase [Jatrophihabitantaceae bacterium]
MLLDDVAAASAEIAQTSARGAKVTRLAALLRQLAPDEAAVAASWLSGELPQRQIGVGWAALRNIGAPAAAATLTISAVDAAFSEIKGLSGPGSQGRRRDLLDGLFGAATAREQEFLRRLLGGDLRQGALVGVMADAVARAVEVPLAAVRRAAMLRGDLAAVAAAVLHDGAGALDAFRLEVGRPISPMLAQTATSTDDALTRLGGHAGFEWKLDGARIQIHRDGDEIGLFTRTLDDVTVRLPEVVELVRALPVANLVADAEAIALRPDGRPQPFAVTASRVGSRRDIASGRTTTPITPFVFDVLHVDGVDLLDEPTSHRLAVLDGIVPEANRVRRLITADPAAAREFLADTLRQGHEGLVAKSLDAPYEAGRRGAGWLKIKPVHTLDLVVLAVEWGSGRRKGWLSNIHLGARDPAGGFVMLGKTFKGMTDEMLTWQTKRFTELAAGPTDQWVVPLRPEQVVEIAFDGLQNSTRYPGGLALRFARVLRYRDDKTAAEADTIETVKALAAQAGQG